MSCFGMHTAKARLFLGMWITVLLLISAQSCDAASRLTGSEFNMQIRNRLEVVSSTEGLSGSYGRWNALQVNYFHQAKEDTLMYVQFSGLSRPEGGGLQTSVGVVKDWSKSFFTQTSVGVGNGVVYLPTQSIDHTFGWKFGKDKQYVWTAGGAYFKYNDDRNDLILKTGLAYYRKKWVFDYQLFRNMSNPGGVESFSHSFSVAYGLPKRHWTTLTYSFGRQAYLASTLATPEAINNYSQFVSLNYRRWLGPHHGFIAEVNYLQLTDAYNKLGFALGFFREY